MAKYSNGNYYREGRLQQIDEAADMLLGMCETWLDGSVDDQERREKARTYLLREIRWQLSSQYVEGYCDKSDESVR